eukprot:TRINITY_DN12233_c0_g1_i1.p1 TRINITY_DN12233_c0_g1~~TRINITY_DN12233_c0_g1_i1.p1  ORF type:complete len:245 (-),score=54.93 TRINITY_DN12233_c0_g1_i1:80-742(-)
MRTSKGLLSLSCLWAPPGRTKRSMATNARETFVLSREQGSRNVRSHSAGSNDDPLTSSDADNEEKRKTPTPRLMWGKKDRRSKGRKSSRKNSPSSSDGAFAVRAELAVTQEVEHFVATVVTPLQAQNSELYQRLTLLEQHNSRLEAIVDSLKEHVSDEIFQKIINSSSPTMSPPSSPSALRSVSYPVDSEGSSEVGDGVVVCWLSPTPISQRSLLEVRNF